VAVQIARMRDAEIAGSCAASRLDEARALGVLEGVDYRSFNANEYRGRFDVVFDTHGALSLSQCGAMLRRGDVALHIVPTPLEMIWNILSSRDQTVFGKVTPQSLGGIVEAVEQGKLVPTIGRTVPLSEAIPAIIELEKTSLPKGKLMIIPMQ
jgi:NADPH:quinone reductase-like Zn-dependent oxidoreductase